MAHANARTTVRTRNEIGILRAAGWTLAQIASQLGISKPTAARWARRYAAGESLEDRSSRPRRMPRLTDPVLVEVIVEARRETGLGPAVLQGHLGIAASTIWKVLRRAGLSRIPRPAREPVVRYERARPGELVHVDIKKLGRVGAVPGHRITGDRRSGGRQATKGTGWEYAHVAVDDRTRLAYVEVLETERSDDAAAFIERATAWFARNHIRIERVMTDNGACYKKRWKEACQRLGIDTRYTRPYRPQTNGKAERFIQTLQREWAYRHAYHGSAERRSALPTWCDHYNTHRYHTSCKSTPWQRAASDLALVNNVRGHYI